ncbi:MAG: PSD1 and planctomycete cytochrome C domain-containing protein [Flavitalea sp.]
MKKITLIVAGLVAVAALAVSCFQKKENTAIAEGTIDFNFDIKPILSDRCFKCHGPDPNNRKADLRLDIEENALAALKDNPNAHSIVPGKPDQSELVLRVMSTDPQYMMPPPESNLTLNDEEKYLLKKWVAQGGKYKKHWAFIPPKKAIPPPNKDDDNKVVNEIDLFVLDRLNKKGMKQSPEADKERLIRRLSFDLTGLPPSQQMSDRFLADNSANAYEKMVDELLASTAYGERWTNYWLDVARYGDTHGYQDDLPRVMWPWRDWVINAFNENMPYDRFVTWQLAGDLLPDATKEQILASAFNRNHKVSQEGGIVDEEYRVEYVADRANTFGKAFMSVSMECSRCHDHKYDPITQKDYFSLYAFFNNLKETGFVMNLKTPEPFMKISKRDVEGELKFLNAKTVLKNDADTILQMVMKEEPGIRKSYILNRGAYDAHGEEVTPDVPRSILSLDNKFPRNRLGLAEWLFADNNPLTARVMVNRLWQELFGKGIVATSEDFGNQGSIPSNPALLDWLAVDFMENKWDIKKILKKMVMSATYKQSSYTDPKVRESDAENIYLSHSSRYRMNSEMIRDNILASAGLLNREIGGPSVKPYQPAGVWEEVSVGDKSGYRGEVGYVVDTGSLVYRRSLYTYWRRTVPPPAMLTFDNPTKELCEVRRTRTSTPLQALVLLNDPQLMEAARVLAAKQIKSNGSNTKKSIADAFRLITCRKAKDNEVAVLESYYNTELAKYQKDKKAAIKVLNTGHYPQSDNPDKATEAALMLTIQTIYNLDETISRS